MPVRAGVLAALAAALAAAQTAVAAPPQLRVSPQVPVVGKRTLIELRAPLRGPLAVRLVSPTGVRTTLRLQRAGAGLWRTSFHFPDDGQWMVRVPRARLAASVLVFQPGAALPPFRPSAGASPLGGLLGPGIVLGR